MKVSYEGEYKRVKVGAGYYEKGSTYEVTDDVLKELSKHEGFVIFEKPEKKSKKVAKKSTKKKKSSKGGKSK